LGWKRHKALEEKPNVRNTEQSKEKGKGFYDESATVAGRRLSWLAKAGVAQVNSTSGL